MFSVPLNTTVYFDAVMKNPSTGIPGAPDTTPKFFVFENDSDTPIQVTNLTLRSGFSSLYRGAMLVNSANGFDLQAWYNVVVSGIYGANVQLDKHFTFTVGTVGLEVLGTGFVPVNVRQVTGVNVVTVEAINANIVQVTGANVVPTDTVNANLVQVSGAPVNLQAVQSLPSGQFAYYADIRLERDTTNTIDEYTVNWFINAVPATSGQITSPTLQVIKRSDGTNLIGLGGASGMNYVSNNIGTLKYDERTNRITVGEPYVVQTVATIDGLSRTWTRLIGRDG